MSNESYNNTSSKEVGGPYDERSIDTSQKTKESVPSRVYRNANDDEG
jgi:hypothetical protein